MRRWGAELEQGVRRQRTADRKSKQSLWVLAVGGAVQRKTQISFHWFHRYITMDPYYEHLAPELVDAAKAQFGEDFDGRAPESANRGPLTFALVLDPSGHHGKFLDTICNTGLVQRFGRLEIG